MAKKTSERGIKAIAIREGEVLHGYKDSKGLLTIGVGHLVTAGDPYKLHEPITKEESRRLLAIDLKEAEDAVNSIGIPILQNEFDALVSLTFNIGSAGFKRSSIVKRLKAHATRKQVAEAILLWNKPPEIQRRRQQEYAQFLTPYPDSAATPLVNTATSPTSGTTNDNPQESSTATPPTTVEQTQTVVTDGDRTASVTETTATTNEPVTVQAVAVSLWTKIVAGITGIAGLGINAGNVIENRLQDITLNQVFIAALSVALIIIAVFYFKKRQESADLKTHLLIEAAANKDKNTVVLTK